MRRTRTISLSSLPNLHPFLGNHAQAPLYPSAAYIHSPPPSSLAPRFPASFPLVGPSLFFSPFEFKWHQVALCFFFFFPIGAVACRGVCFSNNPRPVLRRGVDSLPGGTSNFLYLSKDRRGFNGPVLPRKTRPPPLDI